MATTTSQRPVSSSSAATGEKPSFLLFGGLALIGLLKDTLDLVGIGSLPVLGTAVTLCFSFLSFMLLLIFDRSGGRGNKRLAQGMVVTLGTLVEGIGFVINFLPLQTLTAIFLYLISYKSWKNSQRAAAVIARSQRSKLQTQQARMARAVALREERMRQQTAAADNMVSTDPAPAIQGRAVQTPRLADTSVRPRPQAGSSNQALATPHPSFSSKPQVASSQLLRSSAATPAPFPRARAANDPIYANGGAAANEATLRIRAAGERLSQLRNQGRGHNSAVIPPGQASSKQSFKRAA